MLGLPHHKLKNQPKPIVNNRKIVISSQVFRILLFLCWERGFMTIKPCYYNARTTGGTTRKNTLYGYFCAEPKQNYKQFSLVIFPTHAAGHAAGFLLVFIFRLVSHSRGRCKKHSCRGSRVL